VIRHGVVRNCFSGTPTDW